MGDLSRDNMQQYPYYSMHSQSGGYDFMMFPVIVEKAQAIDLSKLLFGAEYLFSTLTLSTGETIW